MVVYSDSRGRLSLRDEQETAGLPPPAGVEQVIRS